MFTIGNTARSMFTAHCCLPSRLKGENMPIVTCWTSIFWKAVATKQEHTARSLATMAGAKARKIETSTLALNTAKWKDAIGATSLEGRRATPNGLAYRTVKGLTSCTPSSIATSSWEDKGQPEDNPCPCTDEHHLEELIQGTVSATPEGESRKARGCRPQG